jgi:uncharacterized protein (TIGR02246 family)
MKALRILIACASAAWMIAPMALAAAPASLEKRVKQIEDVKAIERLLLEYGRTLDQRDFAAYAALFARDGEWKGALGSYKGPSAIQAAMEKSFAAAANDIPKGRNFHVMSNFIIDVQGDRATANSMFIFYKLNKAVPEAAVAGRYSDVLVRENGAWKFLERNATNP